MSKTKVSEAEFHFRSLTPSFYLSCLALTKGDKDVFQYFWTFFAAQTFSQLKRGRSSKEVAGLKIGI